MKQVMSPLLEYTLALRRTFAGQLSEQSTCIIEQLVKSHGSKAVMYIDDASAESLQIVDFIQSRWKQDIEIFCGDIDGMIDRISGLDHLLCLDSGPAHIAAALGVKLTMIYGPSDEKVYPAGWQLC